MLVYAKQFKGVAYITSQENSRKTYRIYGPGFVKQLPAQIPYELYKAYMDVLQVASYTPYYSKKLLGANIRFTFSIRDLKKFDIRTLWEIARRLKLIRLKKIREVNTYYYIKNGKLRKTKMGKIKNQTLLGMLFNYLKDR